METLIHFSFRCPGAKSVALVGDFNDWSVTAHPMTRDPSGDLWVATLRLAPGRYEYKFFVNGGSWWNDPDAPKVPNAWGSENSYLTVE